ncbi:MAG: transglutaminase family protein [Deltaproteobacteria bacterium]
MRGSIALLTGLVVIAGVAEASAKTRVAIVIDEYIDGKQETTSSVEFRLLEHFRSVEGIELVDPTQAAAVRAAAGGKPLLQADGKVLVDAIDVDRLVIGEVRLLPQDSPIKGLALYRGGARLKILVTGSAKIDGAVNVEGIGRHFDDHGARQNGTKNLTQKIVPKLDEILRGPGPSSPRSTELRVTYQTDVDVRVGSEVVECVRNATKAEKVERGVQGQRELRLDVYDERDAVAIAEAIAGEASCPLFVTRFSDRLVHAEYRPRGVITLAAAAFKRKGGLKKHSWLSREVPKVVRATLGDLDFITTDADLVSKKKALATKRGKIALVGSYTANKKTLRLFGEVRATHRSRVLTSHSTTCPIDEVGACALELAEALESALPEAVQRYRDAIPFEKSVLVDPPNDDPLSFAVAAHEIYPARVGAYAKAGNAAEVGGAVGTVKLVNRGGKAIEDVYVSASLTGFSRAAIENEAPITLAPKATKTVPILLDLDHTKLSAQDAALTSVLEVKVKYRVGDERYPARQRKVGVLVLDRNAMDWKKPTSIAAFVTPQSQQIRDVVASARTAVKAAGGEDALAMPIALFVALSQIEYRHDPKNPWNTEGLDYVLFPAETLAGRDGDCDDLAVVYASLLQAASIPAILIRTPGHVFVGVKTNLPKSAAAALVRDPNRYVNLYGHNWIPLETTKVGQSFEDAWAAGAKEIGAAKKARKPVTEKNVVHIADAWKAFPPIDLTPANLPKAELVTAKVMERQLEKGRAAHDARVKKTIEDSVSQNTAASLNRAGILEVRRGRMDKAQAMFDASLGKKPTAGAENNVGNMRMIQKQPSGGLARYEAALKLNPPKDKRIEVLLNAIVATFRSGQVDQKMLRRRAELYTEAYQLDAERVQAFNAQLPTSMVSAAGDELHAELVTLREELTRFLVSKNVKMPSTTAAPSTEVRLRDFLHWVD